MVKKKIREEFKDISDEELEDILVDEEVEAIYNSIDMKELNRRDKEYKEYKEYTNKSLHPVSYELLMEERSAPQFGITDDYVFDIWQTFTMFCVGIMALMYVLGGLFFLALVGALYP